MKKWQATRDVLCLSVGLGVVIHQEWVGAERPYLLAAALALVGVPGAVGLLTLRKTVTSERTPSPKSSRQRQR